VVIGKFRKAKPEGGKVSGGLVYGQSTLHQMIARTVRTRAPKPMRFNFFEGDRLGTSQPSSTIVGRKTIQKVTLSLSSALKL